MKTWWVFGCLVAMAGVAMAGKEKAPAEKAKSAEKAGVGKADKAPAPDAEAGSMGSIDQPAELPALGEADAAVNPLAGVPHVVGPKQIDLGHQAQIDLPAGMILLEQAAAQEMLRKGGNDVEGVLAVIVPDDGNRSWLVVIEAEDVGYVSDSDADDLDAAGMLEQFKQGTIEQNKKRVAMGVPALILDGWSEPPRYERTTRHLVWGLNGHDVNGKVVNFFTRFLGRNGFLSVDLIDDPSMIEASKVQALSILTAVRFAPGARYEDHVDGDHDSGLGLKALVLGGTGVAIAKKTGILIAILLALKKGFIVVIAAIGGFFKWLFGRKKRDDQDVDLTTPDPPPDLGAPPSVG